MNPTTFTLRQNWQQAPDEGFNPGEVSVTFHGDSLEVEARFIDRHIRDYPAKFNDLAFLNGDVFEVFLMAEGDDDYHEVHVTPSNVLLQLHLRCGNRPRDPQDAVDSRVWQPLVESSTELIDGGWIARVVCDLANFTKQRPLPNQWRAAFCRYDYPDGAQNPIVSSTAPLTARDFHRYQEWHILSLDSCG
jgi:hypothetical protein